MVTVNALMHLSSSVTVTVILLTNVAARGIDTNCSFLELYNQGGRRRTRVSSPVRSETEVTQQEPLSKRLRLRDEETNSELLIDSARGSGCRGTSGKTSKPASKYKSNPRRGPQLTFTSHRNISTRTKQVGSSNVGIREPICRFMHPTARYVTITHPFQDDLY